MIDLNKFTNTKRDKMLHSSGHAQLRRSGYGDLSGRKAGTFEQRRNLAGSRDAVGSYSQSRLVRIDRFSGTNNVRPVARKYDQEDASAADTKNKPLIKRQATLDRNRQQAASSRQEFNSQNSAASPSGTPPSVAPSARYRFTEPAGRQYNPYS